MLLLSGELLVLLLLSELELTLLLLLELDCGLLLGHLHRSHPRLRRANADADVWLTVLGHLHRHP